MEVFERFKETVADLVKPGDKVLDIGTGDGLSLGKIIEACQKTTDQIEWYAIDKSDVILEDARSNLHQYFNVSVQHGNGFELSFEDAEFDIVFGMKSCFDPVEAFRVLKDGGHYIYIGPGDEDWIDVRSLIQREAWPAYRSEEQVRQEMEQTGFTVIDLQSEYLEVSFPSSEKFTTFFKKGFIIHSPTPEETRIVEAAFDSSGPISFKSHIWFVLGKGYGNGGLS